MQLGPSRVPTIVHVHFSINKSTDQFYGEALFSRPPEKTRTYDRAAAVVEPTVCVFPTAAAHARARQSAVK